jgi:hypothetical protein
MRAWRGVGAAAHSRVVMPSAMDSSALGIQKEKKPIKFSSSAGTISRIS